MSDRSLLIWWKSLEFVLVSHAKPVIHKFQMSRNLRESVQMPITVSWRWLIDNEFLVMLIINSILQPIY